MYIDRTRSIADSYNTLLVPHRTDNLYLGKSTFEAKNIYIVNKYPYSVRALTSTYNGAGGGRGLANNISTFPSYKFENIVWDMSGNITASDMTFDYGGYIPGSSPSNLGFLGTHFCRTNQGSLTAAQYAAKKETVIVKNTYMIDVSGNIRTSRRDLYGNNAFVENDAVSAASNDYVVIPGVNFFEHDGTSLIGFEQWDDYTAVAGPTRPSLVDNLGWQNVKSLLLSYTDSLSQNTKSYFDQN